MPLFNHSLGGNGDRLQDLFMGMQLERVDGDRIGITFDDIAGIDEVKEEIMEIVTFLRQPAMFLEMGARTPAGVLMVGPPGTGKTLLAKAIAGEAGVPFFSVAGTEFQEVYSGVGASRVRDMFEKARKAVRQGGVFLPQSCVFCLTGMCCHPHWNVFYLTRVYSTFLDCYFSHSNIPTHVPPTHIPQNASL